MRSCLYPIINVFINVCSWKSMPSEKKFNICTYKRELNAFFEFITSFFSLITEFLSDHPAFFFFPLYLSTSSECFQLQAPPKQYMKWFGLMFLAANVATAFFLLWHPTWQGTMQPAQHQVIACVRHLMVVACVSGSNAFHLAHLQQTLTCKETVSRRFNWTHTVTLAIVLNEWR